MGRGLFWKSALVLFSLGQMAPLVRAEPVPVEDYADLPDADSARLSPDGKAVAMLSPHDKKLGVRVWYPDGRQVWFLPGGTDRVNWVTWKGNDRLLISLRFTDRSGNRLSGATRLLITDTTDYQSIKVTFPEHHFDPDATIINRQTWRPPLIQDRLISRLPNDPDHILLAVSDLRNQSVVRIDARSGQPEPLTRTLNGAHRWLADPQGEIHLEVQQEQIESGRLRLVVRSRASLTDDWNIIHIGELDHGSRFIPLAFSPRSPSTLFVLADQANGRLALQEFDIKTRIFGPVLASDPVCDIDPIVRDDVLIGYVDPCRSPAETYLDNDWSRDQARLKRALKTDLVEIIDRSEDGKHSLVKSAESANTPPTYWYFDESGPQLLLIRIADSRKAIPEASIAPSRWISLSARDGLVIPALLTLPRVRAEGPIGFVVLPHGGPTDHDEEQFDWMVQFFASRGYGVMQPQFRGSTGFGAAFQRAGYRQWGAAMQDDVTDATKWLIDQRLADPKRICIVGASYGGYSALVGAAQHPELYRCAAAIAPVTDIDRLLHDQRDQNELANVQRDRIQGQGGDDTIAAPSPVMLASTMRLPVLLLHGKEDFTVLPSHSEEMELRLRQTGGAVQAIYLEGADHYFGRSADRLTCLKALESFLAYSLGAGSS